MLTPGSLDGVLHYYLIELFENKEEFSAEIQSDDNICERFSVHRLLRRALTAHATNKGMSQVDINIMNRWQAAEMAKEKKPSREIRQHYAKANLLKGPFLRCTGSMQ